MIACLRRSFEKNSVVWHLFVIENWSCLRECEKCGCLREFEDCLVEVESIQFVVESLQ